MAEFVINASEMRVLAKELRVADKESQLAFYQSLEAAGELVAIKARENASSFRRKGRGTNRIANSVAVTRLRGTSVRIQLGGVSAPEGAPIEHHGLDGTFRHPVFGHKDQPWVTQQAHPSLIPAAHEMEAAVIATVDAAVFGAFARLGF